MNRLITLAAAAALGFGCQTDPDPIAHPGALMASTPAAMASPAPAMPSVEASTSPVVPSAMPSTGAPPAEAIAEAAAPIVPTRAGGGSTAGSRASAVDLPDLTCPPGRKGIADAPAWMGGPDYAGSGESDPDELAKIADDEMLARAGAYDSGDADRQHALVSIGRRKLPGAIAVFARSLEASQPVEIRTMALSGLVEHGGPQALPLFEGALRDRSEEVRAAAIWGIALYGPQKAHPAILRGLEDPDPGVQNAAVLATWVLKDRPDLALPILEAAAHSDARMGWQDAFPMLGRLPTSDAANLLARMVHSMKGEKQRAAMRAWRSWLRTYPELCK